MLSFDDMPAPQDIAKKLTEYHVSLVWRELNERFGFDELKWKVRFGEYFKRRPRGTNLADAFYGFGNVHINPVLNEILCRKTEHPTFNKFVAYVVQTK